MSRRDVHVTDARATATDPVGDGQWPRSPGIGDRRTGTTPGRRRRPFAAVLLGLVGELLITAGVLLGLFVVWQLWWTDVVADREQAEMVQSLGWARTDPDLPAVQGPAGDPADEPAPVPQPRRDPPPVDPEPAAGTTFATLQVPRWGEGYLKTISQGTSRREVLDVLGMGHYEGTAMPGAVGNFAVAGHRTTYGKPLNRVEELQVGDPLVVQTPTTWYVYRVSQTRIVDPGDVEVIAPVPGEPGATPTVATMTLTTCHPMYSAQERFIVHATLDHWMPVTDGTPAELDGEA